MDGLELDRCLDGEAGLLHRGGLVDRQRTGRTVLYQVSELGLALLRAEGEPAREVADA
jgi:hypothetical protein